MRCNEIRERFVDLLYQEQGTPSASPELQAHIRSCPVCQKELAELKDLRATLKVWQDEPPLRPVTVPRVERSRRIWVPFWTFARYAAVAVLVTLAFLGLSNAQITWDKDGFSFRTSLISPPAQAANYYKKEEVQTFLDRVMAESSERNLELIQRAFDIIDQQRATDYRTITRQINESRNKN